MMALHDIYYTKVCIPTLVTLVASQGNMGCCSKPLEVQECHQYVLLKAWILFHCKKDCYVSVCICHQQWDDTIAVPYLTGIRSLYEMFTLTILTRAGKFT